MSGVEQSEPSPPGLKRAAPLISIAPGTGGKLDSIVGVAEPLLGVVPDIAARLPWFVSSWETQLWYKESSSLDLYHNFVFLTKNQDRVRTGRAIPHEDYLTGQTR